MDDKTRSKIKDIKSKITAMLKERQLLENSDENIVSPSNYWSDFCSYFDYMLDLSEESLSRIRLHTYHLTGDNYLKYYFHAPENFMKTSGLNNLTNELPSEYVLNEPEGGIGFHLENGRFVSLDIVRYQRAVSTLYRYGILSELVKDNGRRNLMLEIGSGYGGMAHHLSKICGNTTYILVDLPETLLFAASYLAVLNPHKKMYMYHENDYETILQPGAIESWDFVFIPNYRIEALVRLRYDLVINMASFQEMRAVQVEANLDFIRETCRGTFYSFNKDHQPRNMELSNLSNLLGQRFELIEVNDWKPGRTKGIMSLLKLKLKKALKVPAIHLGLIDEPMSANSSSKTTIPLPYREYLCKPIPFGIESKI